MCGGHRRSCERLWIFLLSSLWEKKSDTEIKSWLRWNSNRVPLEPKSQSFQLSHKALDVFSWLKRLFVFGFCFFVWTREQSVFSGQQEAEEHLVIFIRVGKEGGSWYIVCRANNYETREQFTKMFCTWYLTEMHVKTARRELRPGKTWPPGPSSFTGMIPIQEDFTGMRPLQENSSPPFIIRTEKPRRIVYMFSKTW